MTEYIPKSLRERVAAQARYRCGYCLSSEIIIGAPMEIDHIIPRSLGELTEEENLWLACSLCNEHKGARTVALDPLTGEMTPLFNPRRQVWREHFVWTPDGERIIGLTAVGRATAIALALNRLVLIKARQVWVAAGWHPPQD
jgi:hypothetical protein